MFRGAGYRFRATLRSRRGGYLTFVLVVGLVSGVPIGIVLRAE